MASDYVERVPLADIRISSIRGLFLCYLCTFLPGYWPCCPGRKTLWPIASAVLACCSSRVINLFCFNSSIAGRCGASNLCTFRLIPQQLEQATGVEIDHFLAPNGRSARAAAKAKSLRESFPPLTFRCHRACASGSQRRRLLAAGEMRTSFATGLESRVIRISSSTFKAASAAGHRWRKSRMVIVFTGKD